jgi:dipeptidyl-peptidase-3
MFLLKIECRAELVAMHLCVETAVLDIFGFKDKQAQEDIIYICYLNMARAGLLALEFYDPKAKKWGQAHMQARFSILQALIQSGAVHVQLSSDNQLFIELDRSKIRSHGLPAMSKFLATLQVYKATADALNGVAFYEKVTSVTDEWATTYRSIVLKEKQPRKVFVQGNTFLEEGDQVSFKEYPATYEGFIQSFVDRCF